MGALYFTSPGKAWLLNAEVTLTYQDDANDGRDMDTEELNLLAGRRWYGAERSRVRSIVGTLLEVGRGRRDPASVEALLATRDRTAAGTTAPAGGLYLLDVKYPAAAFVPGRGVDARPAGRDKGDEGAADRDPRSRPA